MDNQLIKINSLSTESLDSLLYQSKLKRKLVITISYGDYTIGTGGTDKVILAHQRIFNEKGFDVIHLSPFKYSSWWEVIFNGTFKGIYSNHRLKKFLHAFKGIKLSAFFIHHLKDVNINSLKEILDYCDVPICYYLHDYYTICPKSGLIRENGTFCGNGFPSDKKCKDCAYYPEARKLIEQIQDVISTYEDRITFIAPSNSVKEIWLNDYPQYSVKVKVINHQNLVGEYIGNSNLISNDEPLRIGFVGYQKSFKGWEQFKQASEKANHLQLKERFYQFGRGNDRLSYVEQIDVDFKKSMTAMTDALRDKGIHVAIIWSMVPETYSFTYYESTVSNCFIITNNFSGNVCDQVRVKRNGIVVDDLSEILTDEKLLRKLVNDYRINGHKTPNELKENDEFLCLIKENDWKPRTVNKRIDLSILFSFYMKFNKNTKRIIKMLLGKDVNI